MFAYCLADFFNLGLWPSGRRVRRPDVRAGLEELVTAAQQAVPSVSEITFRLYGGWNGDVSEGRVGVRDITGTVVRQFPKRTGRVRLRFQIAEAPLWDNALRLPRTVRKVRHSHVPAYMEVPSDCPHNGECTLEKLEKWLGGNCPNPDCSASLANAAWRYRQKMVDTLLTADAITAAREDMADVILIATDDEDMIPAVLALKDSDVQAVHLTRSGGYPEYFKNILRRDGVITHEW